MTVIRLVATAILIGRPMTVLRNGTKHPAADTEQRAEAAGDGARGQRPGDGERRNEQAAFKSGEEAGVMIRKRILPHV